MRRVAWFVSMAFAVSVGAHAQWDIETSNTTADLRGIHSIGNGVAWASGTNGTVLRTEDSGYVWQTCAVPPGAEHLDFRGIQGFDANTAIAMSSGKGDLSRLYKTIDGCHTWKLVITNPDADGFWDAISFSVTRTSPSRREGVLIGDPVKDSFPVFLTSDGGESWRRWGGDTSGQRGKCTRHPATALKGESLFAASNQALIEFFESYFLFVTGGDSGARFFYADSHQPLDELGGGPCWINLSPVKLPLAQASPSAGAFAVSVADPRSYFPLRIMIVGGDYQKPDDAKGTAAFVSSRDGFHIPFTSYFDVISPINPPHGYRSSVAYDAATKAWITVGPNGTDISTDDGKNWRPVRPNSTLHEAPDADRNWNAISLPFVVGPHGRVGKLNPAAFKP
jgi:hypothetical protein